MKAGLKQCKRNCFSSNYRRFWVLVDLPYGKKVIGTKWVFRNKRDERSIVMKNKARLVAQATTHIESNKPLVKDEDGVDVDVHVYRSMIGSLMYLTASRPDIMFAVCACARFQVTPKALHLNAVKMIFRYLKHQPKLGLWYPRDSPFELEAYSDSDYGGASLDRKSTTGGCQFLGRRLISWQCKKQTIVANSTTKAEYVLHLQIVFASIMDIESDDGLWISMDLKMDRSCAANSNYIMCFMMATLKYSDKHKYVSFPERNQNESGVSSSQRNRITEASVRSKLQLADATGIHNLSNSEIYAGLATLGMASMDQGEGSTQPAEPHPTPVDPLPSTSLPPIPSPRLNPHSHQSPPHSPHQSPPHSPHQSPPHSPHQSPPHSPHQSPPPPFQSPPYSPPHSSPPRSYEAPLLEGNTSGSAEASIQLKELMKVKYLETALKMKSKKVLMSESESEELDDQRRII
ncbi:uncharacterized mitochondrial protein-like protein [Tanacetum coccineum]